MQNKTLRRCMSTSAVVGDLMKIIKKVSSDDELMKCVEMSMSRYLTTVFQLEAEDGIGFVFS